MNERFHSIQVKIREFSVFFSTTVKLFLYCVVTIIHKYFFCLYIKSFRSNHISDAVYKCLGSIDRNNVLSYYILNHRIHIWDSDPCFKGETLTPKEVN